MRTVILAIAALTLASCGDKPEQQTAYEKEYQEGYEGCLELGFGDEAYCREFAHGHAERGTKPRPRPKSDREQIHEAAQRLKAFCDANPTAC